MISYNLKTVVRLEVFKKEKNYWWTWKPAYSEFFNIFKEDDGFVHIIGNGERQENTPENVSAV